MTRDRSKSRTNRGQLSPFPISFILLMVAVILVLMLIQVIL